MKQKGKLVQFLDRASLRVIRTGTKKAKVAENTGKLLLGMDHQLGLGRQGVDLPF